MPRIETSVIVAAPVAAVFAVAREVEAFPQFMDDVQSVTITACSEDGLTTTTDWVGIIREFRMEMKWTQEDVWDPTTGRDDFRMLKGDMDSMAGSWVFTAVDGGTRFDSVLDYEYNVPLVGPIVKALIKRKMQNNLSAQLEAIKARAEERAKA